MILTLTGPSAAGKTTLERALQERGWGRAISHTTRAARAGEVNGVDYHYINDCTFDALNARGDFIETIDLGTRRYAMSGRSLEVAEKKSGNVVIVVEPHGARQIHNYCVGRGLASAALWIDCGPKLQAERWLERYRLDLEAAGGDVLDRLNVARAGAERMTLMMREEAEWRRAAQAGVLEYKERRVYDVQLYPTGRETPQELAVKVECLLKVVA
jgi:guanylate kinase